MRKLAAFIPLVPLFITIQVQAQGLTDSTVAPVLHALDELIKQTIDANDIPSMSIGVIIHGDITWQKGYGFLERGTARKADEKTVYQIASLSKMFTGIIAHALLLEGKLHMDESISAYLPEELSAKHKKKLTPITLKDLLLHRSGIHRDSKSYKRKDGEPMYSPYTKTHLLRDLEKAKPKRKPRYNYSNVGYALLGYILEKASGHSYEELLRKYVTDQYGLSKTATPAMMRLGNRKPLPDRYNSRFVQQAVPYRKEDRRTETTPWNTGLLTPASGIYSSVADLTKLMLEQLKVYRGGKQGEPVRDSPLYLTKIKDLRGNEKSFYGMGLWTFTFDRGVLLGHSGDMDGYASQYRFNQTTNTGIVLLTSSGGDWTEKLVAKASKIIEEYALRTDANKG